MSASRRFLYPNSRTSSTWNASAEAFLTFRIIVATGQQPICLEITGPPEAKSVIADFFGS